MQIREYPHDKRYKVRDDGVIIGAKGLPLKPSINQGYCYVAIGGKSKKVHRVVCETFVPPVKGMEDVNHKNGIKTDNRLINLEWSNDSHNIKHAFATGLRSHKGENNTRNIIPKICVPIIREAVALGHNPRIIAKYFGVNKNTIYCIKYGINWASV